MRPPDHGEHRDRRPCDLRQSRHLAEAGDAHLHDRGLVLRLDAGYGHRHADLIVQVPLGLQHPKALREHRGDHLLGGGLADAARDAHNGDVQRPAVGGRDLLERTLDVADHEGRPFDALRHPFAERADRALLQRGGDKAVAVGPLAAVGDKEIPRLDGAAVDHRSADRGLRLRAADQAAAAMDRLMLFKRSSPLWLVV